MKLGRSMKCVRENYNHVEIKIGSKRREQSKKEQKLKRTVKSKGAMKWNKNRESKKDSSERQ
jgi:hypothetical protein